MTKSVIIADDDQDVREAYVDDMKDFFPDVLIDQVESGKDLVERVLQGGYSVVISDNDMEKMGAGLSALQEIRKSGNKIPFYLISFTSDPEVGRTAVRYGAVFYSKFFFGSDDFVADISKHLK